MEHFILNKRNAYVNGTMSVKKYHNIIKYYHIIKCRHGMTATTRDILKMAGMKSKILPSSLIINKQS